MSDAKLDQILADIQSLKTGQEALRTEVGALKTELGGLKTEVGGLKTGQGEILAAFRSNWADMSGLYRNVREEVRSFEDRMVEKLGKISGEIASLRAVIEAKDDQNRQLAARVTRLEIPTEPRM
jgi:chromosome segregation ATPase